MKVLDTEYYEIGTKLVGQRFGQIWLTPYEVLKYFDGAGPEKFRAYIARLTGHINEE